MASESHEPAGEETLSERLGGMAYAYRNSPEFLAAKRGRAHGGRDWEAPGAGGPQPPATIRDDVGAASGGFSDRLAGRIAVALILVSGPGPALTLTDEHKLKITSEVQHGLSWLAAQSLARDVTWVPRIEAIAVDVPDTAAGSSYEALEAPWRDAALARLNVGPGLGGVRDHLRRLMADVQAERAFCAFFTRYRLRHFAYAGLGGPRLVMHYDNDGWGAENIDRVFAHETCHIFGAADEYAKSGCTCDGAYGVHGAPNGNCQPCAPGGGVDCIMRANDWAMCDFTRAHLGLAPVPAAAMA
ncbi:MAG: hypothetical protein H7840_04150 [Alphaproteobacteria bacterium]